MYKKMTVLSTFVLVSTFSAWAWATEPVSFNRDVRKILAANCFACHGPDEKTRKGDVRLDSAEAAFAVKEGHAPALVPGDSAASMLIQRVLSADPDERMPPPETGRTLSDREVALLKQWVDEGAQYEKHWSFNPPVQPALPTVSNPLWPRNGLDYFVLEGLDKAGLKPSPEAPKETLIRRAALDLTGLPPAPELVEQFLNDTSAVAYERAVEVLLASPRYGERWARVWLDIARYADTQGYEKDNGRVIWKYRDWVIDALNADLPFDEFTVDQLAGDLLPDATVDQRIATAFHRNTMTNTEGGTDNEEFRSAAVVDRVNTTMSAWMGMTMACAQCHTHKYDPISQKEYFEFYAFLNQTADADIDDESPVMPCPAPDQQAVLDHLSRRQAELDHKMGLVLAQEQEAFTALERELAVMEATAVRSGGWQAIGPIRGDSPEAIYTTAYPFEQDVDPAKTYDGGLKFAARPELDADSTISLFDAGQGAVLYQRLTSTVAQPRTIQLAANGPFRVWLNGTVIYESNEVRRVRGNADVVPVQFNAGDNHLVVKLVNTESRRTALVNLGPLAAPRAIVAAAEKTAADRTAEDTATLESYFKATGAPFTELRAQQAAINEERKSLLATMATVPVLSELPAAQQRQTHIHVRGSFLSPGDAVTAGVPAAFHPFPADAPRNRLGLAQWLVSMDNPLTARVAVNRHWEKFWGTGIVETSEDFGIQGSPPVNQALLDWMAVEFMQHGWSMKELCRMIVTSAAYRQSAAVTPALREVDPYNRLFSRGPRFRLEAEAVRDQALAASGLLSTKMHGPSVMPAQPEGVWQVVYSGAAWETPANEDRHRRGIYTYWRRTSPYPSMVTFDAPSREICTVRRIATNTPLQALVTLNDPVYVEAAQALARRVIGARPESAAAAIHQIVRAVLARNATDIELKELGLLYENAKAHFEERPEDALAMATDPVGPLPEGISPEEAAAWTVVCNAVFNLDETLTRT